MQGLKLNQVTIKYMFTIASLCDKTGDEKNNMILFL